MEGSHNDTEANETPEAFFSGETTTEPTERETSNQISSTNHKETTEPEQATSNPDPTSKIFLDKNCNGTNDNHGAGTSNSGAYKKGDGKAAFLYGLFYQKNVACVIVSFFVKLMQDDETFEFTITSEDPKGGKFDDIVIRCKHGNHALNIFIQAKYKVNAKKKVRLEDLKPKGENDFSLSMYLNDFLYQKWDGNAMNVYVLCTNIGLAEDVKPFVKKISLDDTMDPYLKCMSDDVYEIDVEKIYKNTTLINHFHENSDLNRLAKELADCIYNEKDINCNGPLFQKYPHVIKQIALKTSKNSKLYKVNEDFFKRDDVVKSGFKSSFEEAYRKLFGQQDIWKNVHEKCFKLSRVPKKISVDFVLPQKVDKSKIQKFFNSFRLVCSTKHKKKDLIIYLNKFVPPSLSEPAVDILCDRFLDWKMEWIQEGKGAVLKKDDVQRFFNISMFSLLYLQIEGMSKSYCTSLRNLGLKCKSDRLETRKLYKKLNSWLSEKITDDTDILKVNVQRDQYPSWIVLQILQSVQKIPGNKLNILFLEQKYYEKEAETVKNVFCAMSFPLVLVIDRSEGTNVKSETEISNWCLQDKNYKKMIITIEQFCSSEDTEEQLLFKDLTDDCEGEKREKE